MNTIFMHNVDFKSDHKPYSIFEIYLVKYTNLFQSYTWPHFQFIVTVKSNVYHVKYTNFI